MNDGFVALTRCYFCGEPGDILLNRHITGGHRTKQFIKEADGKVVDMRPCSKCKEFMKQGIILITIDDAKSEKDWDKQSMPNPYRTGGWFVVKDEAIREVVSPPDMADWAIKHRWMFIEHQAAEMLGLFEMAKKRKESE